MAISEPATLLTDYFLGTVSFFFAGKLYRSAQINGWKPAVFWAVSFSCAGTAAFVGGSYHGFAAYLSDSQRRALGHLTAILIASAVTLAVFAVQKSRPLDPKTRRLMFAGLFLTLIGVTVQRSGIQMHEHLNHNDVYHLVQAGALYFLFRGISRR